MSLKIIPQRALTQHRGTAEKICLPVDEVHVWLADLRVGGSALCTCWDLLSEEERKVAAGHRFAKDRRRFVVTRALLRQILAHYVGRAPADLCLDCHPGGKPVLRGTESLHFSVSHSREVSFIAVADREVGIDVEYVQTDALRQEVIEQYLSGSELSVLRALPVAARARALYRCWTQKEAVLKALGTGLLYSPRRVNVFRDGRSSHVLSALGRNWLVRGLAAPAGYAAATAIEMTKLQA